MKTRIRLQDDSTYQFGCHLSYTLYLLIVDSSPLSQPRLCTAARMTQNDVPKGSLKKNCDYTDIVPISFYTHPPEGDRNSNYRDKFNSISTPPLPSVVGTLKLKMIRLKCVVFGVRPIKGLGPPPPTPLEICAKFPDWLI